MNNDDSSSALCNLMCDLNSQEESISHFFWECSFAKSYRKLAHVQLLLSPEEPFDHVKMLSKPDIAVTVESSNFPTAQSNGAFEFAHTSLPPHTLPNLTTPTDPIFTNISQPNFLPNEINSPNCHHPNSNWISVPARIPPNVHHSTGISTTAANTNITILKRPSSPSLENVYSSKGTLVQTSNHLEGLLSIHSHGSSSLAPAILSHSSQLGPESLREFWVRVSSQLGSRYPPI